MWGRPIRRSARQGPLSGSAGSRFFARSGRKIAPAPPAVCALSAAAARLLWPEQWAATARRAPAAYQLSAAPDLGPRKNEIFRLGQLLLRRDPLEPTPPGADVPPTTSSDPEGFRSRPIAFWKAREPLSKAYISTSTLYCDLRMLNGHTECDHLLAPPAPLVPPVPPYRRPLRRWHTRRARSRHWGMGGLCHDGVAVLLGFCSEHEQGEQGNGLAREVSSISRVVCTLQRRS